MIGQSLIREQRLQRAGAAPESERIDRQHRDIRRHEVAVVARRLVEQIRRGIAWLYANIARFGGDPDRIHVSGHSSGGHLAAVLLTTDWKQHGLPEDVIESGVCISGMYDLHPVMLSARSEYLGLSADEVEALSPIRHLDRVRGPITVAYGGRESPEFQRQAREFAAALRATSHPGTLIRVPDDNHFEILGRLGRADGELGRAALDLIAI